MKRRSTAALLLPGTAALVMVWGCPSVPPPPTQCAAATEACAADEDCCEGLTCSDGVCVATTTCAAEGEACDNVDECCDGLTCSAGACVEPTTCAAATEACTETADCCEGLTCTEGVCTEPPPPNTAAVPAKTIGLDLMGIHDPDSEAYNDNCIGCHGDRGDEVALDGVTPAAHATMAAFFGTGNDRCIACHNGGPNFYNFTSGFGSLSKGALREQVDMASVGCANCHGANATPSFYAQ